MRLFLEADESSAVPPPTSGCNLYDVDRKNGNNTCGLLLWQLTLASNRTIGARSPRDGFHL